MSDDIWGKITAVPRPWKAVDFPRKNEKGDPVCQVAIQILSQEEQIVCAAAAEDFTRKMLSKEKGASVPKGDEAHSGYDDIYRNAAAIEVLFRSCRDPNDRKLPAFPGTMHMRTELSTDEVGVLMDHYLTAQAELGPIIARMSKEEVDALVERLMASGDRFPLDLLSPAVLKTLVHSMVLRLSSLLTDKSSAGSPHANEVSARDEGK